MHPDYDRHDIVIPVRKDMGIPFLGGRPGRDITITHEEIIDLRILLNTTNDVEEFVGTV